MKGPWPSSDELVGSFAWCKYARLR
jgi:hypothetical protein